MAQKTRVNSEIRAKTIRVISADGAQVGIVTVDEGLRLAEENNLDLVEVSPKSSPPVCRIMDYGKFKYEQSKRAKESRKHQQVFSVKEIKMRPKIEEHDYQFKVNHVKRFLSEGNKTKVTVMYRGREMAHVEIGRNILDRVITDTAEVGEVEQAPKVEGRNMVMILAPRRVRAS